MDASDPRIAALEGELGGLPPMFVMASATESLRGESIELVRQVRQAGGHAEYYEPPQDLPHVWVTMNLPESVEDTAILAHWIVGKWSQ